MAAPDPPAAFLADVARYEAARADIVAARKSRGAAYLAGKATPPFTGLINQGGTCYLNSLLQSLFATDPIRRAVFRWRYDGRVHGALPDCMPAQLQALFARLALTSAAATSTEALTAAFGWTSEDAFIQHDVQELCRVLFEALERADTVAASMASGDSSSGGGGGGAVDPHGAPAGELASAVRTCFTGQLADTLVCHACNAARTRVDDFADLELSLAVGATPPAATGGIVPPPIALTDCLAAYITPETLSGTEGVTCSSCGVRGDSTKSLSLRSLPTCLMLHLKRFRYDMATGRQVKINDPVDIPLTLDMAPFLPTSHHDAALSGGGHVYELYAVLMHSGGAGGGHYYVFVKRPGGGATAGSRGEWVLFNDAGAAELTASEVSEAMLSAGSPAPASDTAAAPLAKPQYAETAAVKPEGGEGAGHSALAHPGKASAPPIPRNGTPYLLLYRRVEAARGSGADGAVSDSATSWQQQHAGQAPASQLAYGASLGAHLLPAEVAGGVLSDNATADRLRAAQDARNRMIEVTCLLPHTVPDGKFSSGPDYAAAKPAVWMAPRDMTVEQLTTVTYARWGDSVAGAVSASAGWGGTLAQWPDGTASRVAADLSTLPQRHNVRLRRYDPSTRLPLDTYSSPEALAATADSAGWAESVALMLEVRPPVDTSGAVAGPPPWPEYDPHAVTLRVYRWCEPLRAALQATAAAIAAATAGAPPGGPPPPPPVTDPMLEGVDLSQVDPAVAAELGITLPPTSAPAAPSNASASAAAAAAVSSARALASRLECVDITFPGVRVHSVTLDDLSAAIAASSLGIPITAQSCLVLAQGGLPVDVGAASHTTDTAGGGGAADANDDAARADAAAAALSGSLLSRGGPVWLSPVLPGATGLYRDCGASNGDAVIVEVVDGGDGGECGSESFPLLKAISTSEGVTVCANLVIPDAWQLPDAVQAALHMLADAGTAAPDSAPADGDMHSGGPSVGRDGPGSADGVASAAAAGVPSGSGMDLSGVDEETKAAILAALAADGPSSEPSGSGGGGGKPAGAVSPTAGAVAHGMETSFPVQVRARRLDTLVELKRRIAAAVSAEVARRLPEAWAIASRSGSVSGSPPDTSLVLDPAKLRLSRAPRTPHWRNESLRLHDLDVGHLATVFAAPAAPLRDDELVVQPTLVLPFRRTSATADEAVGSKVVLHTATLPRLVVRQGLRVSALRKQLLTHARLAVDRLTSALTKTGEWEPVVPASALTPAHLRVRVRNTPPAPVTAAVRAPPSTLAAVNVAAYSSILRDDAALRTGLSALAKAAQAADAGSSNSGTAIDVADVLVEALPSPETLTAADMVLRLREYRPAAPAAEAGKAKAAPATLSAAVEVVADRAATTSTLAALIRTAAPAAASGLLRVAKPAAFGPPTTAATAGALKWEVVPGTEATSAAPGAEESPSTTLSLPTLPAGSLTAPPLSLRDGAALFWRCDTPTAADITAAAAAAASAGPKTGAAAAKQYGRIVRGGAATSGGSGGSGGGTSMDGMVVIKGGGGSGGGGGGRGGERGVRIRMAGGGTGTGASGPSPVNTPVDDKP